MPWRRPPLRSMWRWGHSNSTAAGCFIRGQRALGGATCGYCERLVTAPARCCPWFTARVRTQHGPTRVRIRVVAGAFGDPVLRDQGLDRAAGHGKADSCHRLSRLVIAKGDGGQSSLITARCCWVGTRQPDKPCGAVTMNQRIQREGAIG
jgi:hypothetical protein